MNMVPNVHINKCFLTTLQHSIFGTKTKQNIIILPYVTVTDTESTWVCVYVLERGKARVCGSNADYSSVDVVY